MNHRIRKLASSSRIAAGGVALAVAVAVAAAIPAAASAGSSAPAYDPHGIHHYRVTITNLTKGQPISPPLLVTNYGNGAIYKLGRQANWGVEQIAENGNNEPLFQGLKTDQSNGFVTGLVRATAPLLPKGTPGGATFSDTVTLDIAARGDQKISFISMIGCTNDGFVGVNAARLPKAPGRTVNVPVQDFDAGTEENTEDFADLTPGCQAAIGVKSKFGATGATETDWHLAENGVVHPHEGVQDVSDDGLQSAVHGWAHNKAASLKITQID